MAALFSRNGCSTSSENDDWDDTELIKAYDLAVSSSKQKIKESLNAQCENKSEKPARVGAPCRAIYDADNIEYEATIINIENEHEVTVQYIGYGNTQKVPIKRLRPSHGSQARIDQEQAANELENMDTEVGDSIPPKRSSEKPRNPSANKMSRLSAPPPLIEMNMFGEMSFPPPPPFPPSFAKNMKSEEHEALNSMLMSWYMSGYYTGYYQGLKESKK